MNSPHGAFAEAPPAPAPAPGVKSRWRETLSVFGHAGRTLRLVADVDRGLLFVLLFVQVADALANVAIVYVGKRIIDAVIFAARSPGHALGPILAWVATEFALVAVRAAVSQWNDYTQVVLRARLGLHVNLRILEKAANVSYGHFEDPAFMNAMAQARREATSSGDLCMQDPTFDSSLPQGRL
ncbi:MAG: hypothetical protein WCJ30_26970, partial [Deltaproteobacteria bacterium]